MYIYDFSSGSAGRTSTKSSIKRGVHIHPSFAGIVRTSQVAMETSTSPVVPEPPIGQEIPRIPSGTVIGLPGQIMTSDLSQESCDMSIDDDQGMLIYHTLQL